MKIIKFTLFNIILSISVLCGTVISAPVMVEGFALPAEEQIHIVEGGTSALTNETPGNFGVVDDLESHDVEMDFSELLAIDSGYAVPFCEEGLLPERYYNEKAEMELWHIPMYFAYSGEIVTVPVASELGQEPVIVDGKLSDTYNRIPCMYNLYANGIYRLVSLNSVNSDALDSANEDSEYLVIGDRNVKLSPVAENVYMLENADLDRNVAFTDKTVVLEWSYDDKKSEYELVKYDMAAFADAPSKTYDTVNYLVMNNPDSDTEENLALLVAYTAKRPVNAIVAMTNIGVDENGKYRNYYNVLVPMSAKRMENVQGNVAADSAALLPKALKTGSVVCIKDGFVDEQEYVSDTDSEGYLGFVDTADSKSGLVWLSLYDGTYKTVTAVPEYVTEDSCCQTEFENRITEYEPDEENPDVNFDSKPFYVNDGEITYKITDNTVVAVLRNDDAGEQALKWGTFTSSDIDSVFDSNSCLCYNNKVADKNGNYTTKYAPCVLAYISASETANGMPEADYIIVVVNKLDEKHNNVFVSAESCIYHDDAAPFFGECGDRAQWILDENGTLTVSGSGSIKNGKSFENYRDLVKKVVVGDGITALGYDTFEDCINLSEITIGKDVTDFGHSAFIGCTALDKVYITNLAAWSSVGFKSSSSNPMSYASGLYVNGELLTSLTTPEGMEEIGVMAFGSVDCLENAVVSSGTKVINKYAFKDSCNLKTVTLPRSLEKIISGAFDGCTKLETVYYEGSYMQWQEIAIGNENDELLNANIVCKGDEEIVSSGVCGENLTWTLTLGGTLTISGSGDMTVWGGITSSVWFRNTDIKNVIIEDGVTSISDYSFVDCYSLTSVEIPESVTELGWDAFASCRSLESVVIPGSVEKIPNYAFNRCYNLKSVIIKEGVKEISGAFSYCTSLKEIVIPDSVERIGGSFDYCSALEKVTLGKNLKEIGGDAFLGCTSLQNVILPEKLETIGSHAFRNCKSMTEIVIPDSVTFIGSYAFERCENLENITLGNSVEVLSQSAFEKCHKLKTLTIPTSVKTIYEDILFDCNSFETVYYEGGASQFLSIEYLQGNFDGFWEYERVMLSDPSDLGITGTCGENVTWLIDKDRTLIISGEGDMERFRMNLLVPWRKYKNIIDKVYVDDGVTCISAFAFFELKIKSISLGADVKVIDEKCFGSNKYLKDIYYRGTQTGWLNIENNTTLRNDESFKEAQLHIMKVCAKGDSNGDDSINIQDVVLLAQYCADWEEALNTAEAEALDVNGDGRVDVLDVVLLARHCAGWDVTLG